MVVVVEMDKLLQTREGASSLILSAAFYDSLCVEYVPSAPHFGLIISLIQEMFDGYTSFVQV